MVDLLGGGRGALRQRAHFVGYHGEAAPLVAGPRRLDGGVEGEQVGLVGDALDHIDHTADLVAVLGQATHRGPGLAHRLRQALDGVARLRGDVAAARGQFVGLLCGVGGHWTLFATSWVVAAISLTAVATCSVSARCCSRPAELWWARVSAWRACSVVFGGVLQARQASLQTRVLAEDGHFQARLVAAAVGVHLRDQRVGGGLFGEPHQALQPALLPAQSGQAERNGEQAGEDEAPPGVQPDTDEEADLADQDERQPIEQYRQPAVAPGGSPACRRRGDGEGPRRAGSVRRSA